MKEGASVPSHQRSVEVSVGEVLVSDQGKLVFSHTFLSQAFMTCALMCGASGKKLSLCSIRESEDHF